MNENDRKTAIEMYEYLFDGCSDNEALSKGLVSPTRQAVVLARVYDSKSQDDVPAFITAVEDVCKSVLDAAQPGGEELPQSAAPAVPVISIEPETAEPVSPEPVPAPAPLPVQPAVSTPAPAAEHKDEVDSIVDKFVADLNIQDDVSAAEKAAAETPAAPQPAPAPVETPAAAEATQEEKPAETDTVPAETADKKPEVKEEKSKTFLLVLYIILAIPLTALGICLLLVPTLAFLLLGVTGIASGLLVIIAAFGNFAMFADILVVLGVGLILLALGVLFLWTAIWFVGGAIKGLINLAIKNGNRIAGKEEAAETAAEDAAEEAVE